MRKPSESLDDFIVKSAANMTATPPRKVWLRLTGDFKILKPLARRDVTATTVHAPQQPIWFRRLVVVGSGALVMIAFVLVSAILIGISDPSAGPDVATNAQLEDELAQTEEPFGFDGFSVSSLAEVTGEVDIVRSHVRRRPSRTKIRFADYRPEPELRPLPQPEEPKFIPTTLIIYAENGVIRTRIEPWLQDSFKELPTLNN